MSGDATFRKDTGGRPAAWEAAGLAWLAAAEPDGGAAVVRVIEQRDDVLVESRVDTAPPTPSAAEEFGRRLARTHDAAGIRWGEGPPGWRGEGYQGPSEHLLPLSLRAHATWGQMYAAERIMPLVRRSGMPAAERRVFGRLCDRLAAGDFDTPDAPARLHGDLWAGNVLWSPVGCVLIDPSAHGGHRETDLAALALFGCDHLDRIVHGYVDAYALSDGWRDRMPLHQLSMVLMHAVVFGGGYVSSARDIARRYAG